MMREWVVREEGWILGKYRFIGETFVASDDEAKWVKMAGTIAPKVNKPVRKRKHDKHRD